MTRTLAVMPARRSVALLDALAAVAPGTPLREGLDRILQASMGALIVVGDGPEVLNICSGGFLLDAAFSPQRLSELAKMDGAIILAGDASRIARANVHLVPNPNVPDLGDRHPPPHRRAGRPLDRRAGHLGVRGHAGHHRLRRRREAPARGDPPAAQPGQPGAVDARALQAPARHGAGRASALEVEDLVTLRDVVTVLQRTEMVRRIAEEIEGYIVELGDDGRLVRLQLEELMGGVERRPPPRHPATTSTRTPTWHLERGPRARWPSSTPTTCSTSSRSPPRCTCRAAGVDLDTGLQPRGFRLLSKIPRLPEAVVERIVDRFGNLQKIMRATHRRPRRRRGRGRDPGPGHQGGPVAPGRDDSILDRYN